MRFSFASLSFSDSYVVLFREPRSAAKEGSRKGAKEAAKRKPVLVGRREGHAVDRYPRFVLIGFSFCSCISWSAPNLSQTAP
jgi:hypothetical protein